MTVCIFSRKWKTRSSAKDQEERPWEIPNPFPDHKRKPLPSHDEEYLPPILLGRTTRGPSLKSREHDENG